MQRKVSRSALALKFCGAVIVASASLSAGAVIAAGSADTASAPTSAQRGSALAARVIDPKVLAQVVPGISKSQVKSLLGDPWRTVQYNDLEEVENELWEYRGKDAHGTYRVHIEFNHQGTVVIVGKVPDAASPKGTRAQS